MFEWFSEPFATTFTQNALKELALISILSGVVGTYVVLRGIAFIVDGLSHAILPGVAIALLVGNNIFWGALLCAILVTTLISITSNADRVSEDSAIGIFFTGAFALGVIIISKTLAGKSSRGSPNDIFFGQIFGITDQDLTNTLLVGGLIVGLLLLLRKELLITSFDPVMARATGLPVTRLNLVLYLTVALTIVVALPAVGNILVLAFLITPAATARLVTDRLYPMMVISAFLALFSSLCGIYLSYYLRLAGAASIVVVATLLFLLALVISPHHGLVAWYIHRKKVIKVAAVEQPEGAR